MISIVQCSTIFTIGMVQVKKVKMGKKRRETSPLNAGYLILVVRFNLS